MGWITRGGPVPSFTREETVLAGVTSGAIKIPTVPAGRDITVTALPGAGTALVEFTTSSDAKVVAGTATWQEWPAGAVAADTSDRLLGPVTALRLTAAAAAADFEIIV